jgi:hypothetical protein
VASPEQDMYGETANTPNGMYYEDASELSRSASGRAGDC